MIDFTGHIGYLFILVGMVLISKKNIYGWLFRFVGETIWMVLGFYLELSSVVFWGMIFMVIDIYGFKKWKN